MSKTAEKFWTTRQEYPPVTCNFQRRYLDLGIILRYADSACSILDLGCGEGQNLLMLRELTTVKYYYAYDLSQIFIDNLILRWGNWPGLDAKVGDFTTVVEFPKTDVCICMGVLVYVDDTALEHVLSNITSGIFICRMPCSLESSRAEIDKFSEEYQCDYAAVYRTIPEYISTLSKYFIVKYVDRCYPDEIESKYGTKQFFFVCERI